MKTRDGYGGLGVHILPDLGPLNRARTDRVLELLSRLQQVIEDLWFQRKPLSEREIYARFAQQQQQQ